MESSCVRLLWLYDGYMMVRPLVVTQHWGGAGWTLWTPEIRVTALWMDIEYYMFTHFAT